MTGITAITRKTKQVYRVAFSFKGAQCREVLNLPHSKGNETFVTRLRAEILRKIELDTFRYTDYFPDSPRAAVFGHGVQRDRTLSEALLAYRGRVEKTLEPSTFTGYRKAIDNVLIPWCGAMKIDGLKPADVREWMARQTVTLKRIRNILLPLRAVLDEAVADELIPFNPIDRVDLAKLVPVDKRTSDYSPQPYTADELHAVLAGLPQPERWIFQLWAYTGLRTGELIGLRWARVDLEANTLAVTETTTERKDKARPKTRAGLRTIPLLPAARQAVDGLKAFTLLAGDRVAANPRSTREDQAWDDKRLAEVWKKAHKGTGVAYRNPYQLRHTYASNLLSEGENVALIAKLLGHETIEMTIKHYGRWVGSGVEAGLQKRARSYGLTALAPPRMAKQA